MPDAVQTVVTGGNEVLIFLFYSFPLLTFYLLRLATVGRLPKRYP